MIHLAWYWFLLIILGVMIFAAQITSHEERALNYNLEDEEIDYLTNIEARLTGAERRTLTKIKNVLALAKIRERIAVGWVKTFFRRLLLWRS